MRFYFLVVLVLTISISSVLAKSTSIKANERRNNSTRQSIAHVVESLFDSSTREKWVRIFPTLSSEDQEAVFLQLTEYLKVESHSEVHDRICTALVLSALPNFPESIIPHLINCLSDTRSTDVPGYYLRGGYSVQEAVIEALKKAFPHASNVTFIVTSSVFLDQASNETLKEGLAEVFWAFGEEAIPILQSVLEDSSEGYGVKFAAAVSFSNFAGTPNRETALRTLRELAGNTDRNVRRGVMSIIDEYAPESIPILITAIDDPDDQVVSRTCDSLGRLGLQAKQAVPKLYITP